MQGTKESRGRTARGEFERPVAAERPETSSDLTPTKALPIAEIVLIPFFWLAPAMLAGLGYAMSRDAKALKRKFGVEIGEKRYLFYVMPFVLSHLAGLFWRTQRRNWIVEELGFELSAFARARKAHAAGGHRRPVAAVAGVQLLSFLLVAAIPMGFTLLLDAAVAAFLLSWIAGPFVVGYDAYALPRTPHVDWGDSRYAYVLAAFVPLLPFAYLVRRDDHVWYATLVEHWDADPAELRLDDGEKSRTERLADRLSGGL